MEGPLSSPIYLGVMLYSVSQLKQADIYCVPHSGVQIVPPAREGNQVWYNLVYLVDLVRLVFFCQKKHINN